MSDSFNYSSGRGDKGILKLHFYLLNCVLMSDSGSCGWLKTEVLRKVIPKRIEKDVS